MNISSSTIRHKIGLMGVLCLSALLSNAGHAQEHSPLHAGGGQPLEFLARGMSHLKIAADSLATVRASIKLASDAENMASDQGRLAGVLQHASSPEYSRIQGYADAYDDVCSYSCETTRMAWQLVSKGILEAFASFESASDVAAAQPALATQDNCTDHTIHPRSPWQDLPVIEGRIRSSLQLFEYGLTQLRNESPSYQGTFGIIEDELVEVEETFAETQAFFETTMDHLNSQATACITHTSPSSTQLATQDKAR